MRQAIGISIHTGWAAFVVVGGSLAKPEIIANEVIEILGDPERFCFHRAADMERDAAEKWIAAVRKKAAGNAARELGRFVTKDVRVCALVAKSKDTGALDEILASHTRIHTAEGCFYRDVLRDACPVTVRIVAPDSLDVSTVGKLAPPPWGRDQKLAALAAWSVMKGTEKVEKRIDTQ
jgi:hypothetical protein